MEQEAQEKATGDLVANVAKLQDLIESIDEHAREVRRFRQGIEPLDNYQGSLVRRSEQQLRNDIKDMVVKATEAYVNYQEAIYNLAPISFVQQIITRLIRLIARDRHIPF